MKNVSATRRNNAPAARAPQMLLRRGRGDEFLEARIIPERIEHWIEPEQRGSEPRPQGSAPYGIESSFCKAAMARSGSPICAATRARISIDTWTTQGVLLDRIRGHGPLDQFECGGFVTKAHIGQREISHELTFSGCSLRKDSSSLRACRQLSWAAAWSPATSCAQPNKKRSSPLV